MLFKILIFSNSITKASTMMGCEKKNSMWFFYFYGSLTSNHLRYISSFKFFLIASFFRWLYSCCPKFLYSAQCQIKVLSNLLIFCVIFQDFTINRFTPSQLFKEVEGKGLKLGMVIDLTNTSRYYNGRHVSCFDIVFDSPLLLSSFLSSFQN